MKEQVTNILLSISRTLRSKKVTFTENRVGPKGDTYSVMYSLDIDGTSGQILVEVYPDGIDVCLNDDTDELDYDETVFVEEGQRDVSDDVKLLVNFLRRKRKAEKRISKLLKEVHTICDDNGLNAEYYLEGGFPIGH